MEETNELIKLSTDMRERLVHIEDKVDYIINNARLNQFIGCSDQRYGHISYSQHGEDMLIASILDQNGVIAPFYIDIGANHPFCCSNTALLFVNRQGRGINIDASPDNIALFNEHRPNDININVGITNKNGILDFYRIDPTSGRNSFSKEAIDNFLGEEPNYHINDIIKVPVITLDELISDYALNIEVDFLNIDVEGLDYTVLESYSFISKPKIICVEIGSVHGERVSMMDDLLIPRGYSKLIQMHVNGIYVRSDLSVGG